MAIKVSSIQNDTISILEPRGSLIGDKDTDELKTRAREILEKGRKKLIIDLGAVNYINSSGIGTLVSIFTSYTNAGGKIKLCNLGKSVHNIFVITKLMSVFDVEGTRDEAVKKF